MKTADECGRIDNGYSKKPKQYRIGIDTFERAKANASRDELIGFCKFNIDKYIHRKKGSDELDLIKCQDYIDLWLWTLGNKDETPIKD